MDALQPVLRFILWFYGFMLIVGPIVLRLQIRYRARYNPQQVPLESLPPKVRTFIADRISGIATLGFQPIAYLDFGSMATNTQSYMALFSNPATCEWADISVVTSPIVFKGYIEFISRCSEATQVDTNTNATASILGAPAPGYHVFRFPQIADAFTLYRAHRMLVQENTQGASPVLPPPGQEVAELKRRLERYGPLQVKRGYMYLDRKGEYYRLTWKGAILGGWRSVWPVPVFRKWGMKRQNGLILQRLGVAH